MTFNSTEEKRQYVRDMFGRIAPRYDLMNRVMTGGRDLGWRKLLIREAKLPVDGAFLDIATGTGDIALEALHQHLDLDLVVGGDFALPMMGIGRERPKGRRVAWVGADTQRLAFASNAFDAVASGFLLRNVTDVRLALAEQTRVCKPGGRVLVLDIPRPADTLVGRLFRSYFHRVVPRMGSLISGQADAYAYLPQSADLFLRPDELKQAMEAVGLNSVYYRLLMMGTVALHVGIKSQP
jgi:demethylmenaquinone methyltransferase / 2-methoxy-6-polyprenyl-1,4-benzoquinol methylase